MRDVMPGEMSRVEAATVVGVLLAGGQSRRMREAFSGEGGDKGLLDIAGKPMLQHAIDRIRPQVGSMVINANGDPARFRAFGLPVVSDTIEGFAGPLAGVLAGLRWAEANAPGTTHIVSAPADAPFLPADLVKRLSAGLVGGMGAVAIARSNGSLHPVVGLWPLALADDLESAVRAGVRKVLAWTDRHGTVAVDFPLVDLKGGPADPFFNANTPEDLAEARALLDG